MIFCAWLSYVLRFLPFIRRPKWTRPFVQELPPCPDLPLEHTKHRLGWVIALLVISVIGSAAEFLKIVLNGMDLANWALFGSWVSRPLSLL